AGDARAHRGGAPDRRARRRAGGRRLRRQAQLELRRARAARLALRALDADLLDRARADRPVLALAPVAPRPRAGLARPPRPARRRGADRKSTRLNSSHEWISYAVFFL